MLALAQGWLAIQIIGLLTLPLALALFPSLPDRGYTLAKALGLLLLAYILWLGGSLGLIPFTRPSIMLFLLLLGIASVAIFLRRKERALDFFRKHWRYLLVSEAVFAGAYLGAIYLRALNPALNSGEKLGDFGFLSSVLRARSFPPEDFWLAGEPVNYYYFGYVMAGAWLKLAGVHPAVGYNLALGLFAGLAALGAFGLLYNLVGRKSPRAALGVGLGGVVLVLVIGNLEGALEFLAARGIGGPGFWGWVGVPGLEANASPTWYPSGHAWWWRATRVIGTYQGGRTLDYTITEFPFFSFYFGDLHPHLMALPFALLVLAFLFYVFLAPRPWDFSQGLQNGPFLVFLALALGALGFLNSWDLPVYALLLMIVLALHTYAGRGRMGQALALGGLALALGVGFYLPFYWGLKNPVLGPWPWLGPASRPLNFLIVWGFLLLMVLGFLLRQLRSVAARMMAMGLAIGLLLLALAVAPVAMVGSVTLAWARLPVLLPLALIFGLALAATVRRAEEGRSEESLALLLVLFALLLLGGIELFYLRDFMGTRQNTVFKFSFQAWLLLGLGATYGLYSLASRWRPPPFLAIAWWGLVGLLLLAVLLYPAGAIASLKAPKLSLDGLAFLDKALPGEREAIEWLRGREGVVLEGVGEEYSLYGRASAFSGLPAVLGQPGHELVWRGPGAWLSRQGEVERVFRSRNEAEIKRVLSRYRVSYIYLGRLEREQYGPATHLEGLFPVAFRNNAVTIYQVGYQVGP